MIAIQTRRFSNHESRLLSITYFCNHCNIRFENTSKYVDTLTLFPKIWTKGHWPLDDRWPHVCWGHMCDSTQGSLCPSPMTIHQCMWIEWSILQITTYIHFANYHIHTHTMYILRTYYVQNEWSHSLLLNSVQARHQRWKISVEKLDYIPLTWEPRWVVKVKANMNINYIVLINELTCTLSSVKLWTPLKKCVTVYYFVLPQSLVFRDASLQEISWFQEILLDFALYKRIWN